MKGTGPVVSWPPDRSSSWGIIPLSRSSKRGWWRRTSKPAGGVREEVGVVGGGGSCFKTWLSLINLPDALSEAQSCTLMVYGGYKSHSDLQSQVL